MYAPINKLLVKLEKKLYDSRTFESGQTIYFDPNWHPEEYAMLKATVVSIPPGVIDRKDYRGYKIVVKPGDEILIRYDVVFAYYDQPERDTPIYKNILFQFNASTGKYEEFWLCDILQVFAIIKGNQFEMINGFVMLDIIEEKQADYTGIIVRPDNYKNIASKSLAKVKATEENTGFKQGDFVFINPQTVMQYQLNLKQFYIIKQQYVLGKLS